MAAWRLVKGEIGMRLDIWHMNLIELHHKQQYFKVAAKRWLDNAKSKALMKLIAVPRAYKYQIRISSHGATKWHLRLVTAGWNKFRSETKALKRGKTLGSRSLRHWFKRNLSRALNSWFSQCQAFAREMRLVNNAIRILRKQALHKAYRKWRHFTLQASREVLTNPNTEPNPNDISMT